MSNSIIKAIKIMLGGGTGDDEGPDQEEVLEDYDTSPSQEKEDNLRSESKRDRSGDDSAVPDVSEYHKNLIAPTTIDKDPTKASIGEHEVRTIFINQWPDRPSIGFLDEVFMDTNVVNDVSIHLSPYRSDKAKKEVEDELRKSQSRAENSGGSIINKRDQQRDFQQTQEVFNALDNTNAKLFDVSMYITIRGETEQELELATDQVVKKLQTSPAFTKPEVPKREQLKAFQSVSPIGEDNLNYSNEMLGGAIGAMFPFSSTSFIEKNGIDYGIHAGNDSPIIIDRFGERETGYNQLTFGTIGSGKSFGTELEILRSYISRDNTKIIMIDPLDEFKNVNDALGGKEIVVGGKLGLNPMEIQKTPEKDRDDTVDKYGMTKSKAIDFFDMYFHQRGQNLGEIENGRGILERAIDKAYRDKGIMPGEHETYDNESPTVLDVYEILQDMQENPENYAEADSPVKRDHIETAASNISLDFEPFKEGGEYHNLAQQSEIELHDRDVHYINLKQREGSKKTGLMMHLLLSEVYEAAKQHDGNTLLAIDEAHKLLQDARSIDFLEQVVRHSRHQNLGINFVTQTIEEFFQDDQAKAIAQLCSIKKFHQVKTGLDEHTKNALGLGDKEEDYIQTAQAGGEDVAFSQALVGVGNQGYIPCLVVASDFEEDIITYEGEGNLAEQIDTEQAEPDVIPE